MNSKKIFLSIAILCLSAVIFVPFLAKAEGNPTPGPIVSQSCGQSGLITIDQVTGKCTSGATCPCTLCDFFRMLTKIYNFIVWDIATPLAVIALTIGGIMMMLGGINSNLWGTGKKMVFTALIGVALVFASYIIIGFVLKTIGYTGSWTSMDIVCK